MKKHIIYITITIVVICSISYAQTPEFTLKTKSTNFEDVDYKIELLQHTVEYLEEQVGLLYQYHLNTQIRIDACVRLLELHQKNIESLQEQSKLMDARTKALYEITNVVISDIESLMEVSDSEKRRLNQVVLYLEQKER